ncbi:D-alanine--D-alanine ligase [Roseimarinus sediminis]|uniref:D-alanine--D-alanine ligase n=1 Tax=Roseimarinus sediminis TaxID=1610899 RepID=UPI003D23CD49
MKRPIAIIGGGNSSEYVVSINSSANIFKSIDTELFVPWMIRIRFDEWVVMNDEQVLAEVDKSDFSFVIDGQKIRPDYAFIMIHGTPGEDGVLQAYFDLQAIPYSSCGVYASSLTFHKFYCDNFLRAFNYKMARSRYFKKGDKIDPKAIVEEIGLPLFIKPSAGGSSFGVTKVKTIDEVLPAIELAYNESNDCLCEEFIEGMELAVGVCELNGEIVPFLPTEVIPRGEFFDFDSKYVRGGATEITPARLPQEKLDECMRLTAEIYRLIACHGIVRVDYILKEGEFYFLEINTVPGMTATSFIPQQLNAMGLNLKEVVSQLIEGDLKK